MDAVEAKLRCLELAIAFVRRGGESDEKAVVETSTLFYNHISDEPSTAAPAKRGRPPKSERQA